MNGVEGIDYVVTECGHCKGGGKCTCLDCACRFRSKASNTDVNNLDIGTSVVRCSICGGVGKVVFWCPKGSSGKTAK